MFNISSPYKVDVHLTPTLLPLPLKPLLNTVEIAALSSFALLPCWSYAILPAAFIVLPSVSISPSPVPHDCPEAFWPSFQSLLTLSFPCLWPCLSGLLIRWNSLFYWRYCFVKQSPLFLLFVRAFERFFGVSAKGCSRNAIHGGRSLDFEVPSVVYNANGCGD